MALQIIGYENFRTVKLNYVFTGASNFGADNTLFSLDMNPQPALQTDEFVYEVFYRVLDPLVSSNTATSYLRIGLDVDDTDAILNSTTGILDTLNTNQLGFRLNPAYTKATDERLIICRTLGGNDITVGELEIILTIARCNEVELDFAAIASKS
jgi:hypothetical protein